jgi:glycosyltransferase involved in cell wall biosynthesis
MSADNKKLRILWVNSRLLHPLNGGDRIRTYNMLKCLKRRHHVTYLCFRTPEDPPESVTRAKEFCDELITVNYTPVHNGTLKFFAGVVANSAFGKVPFFAEKFRSPEMTAHIQRFDATGAVDLIVVDYLVSMIHVTGIAKNLKAPLMLFQHNVESQIWKRHAETTGNAFKRAVFNKQWRLTCDWDRSCDSIVSGQVTVSEDDYQFFRQQLGLKKVLGSVPTGVDLEYFSPPAAPRQSHSLIFLGSMDWMPNMDAVQFFVAEAWPLVKKKYPRAKFTIVGRNPPAKIKELEQRIHGVHVTGTVDDVRPYLHEATAMVVPLRVGGGTRIKIFEGMATAIPVISSRIGAEGLPVTHGENALLADTGPEFAAQIVECFANPDRAARIGANARALVQAQFGWEAVTDIFEAHIQHLRRK